MKTKETILGLVLAFSVVGQTWGSRVTGAPAPPPDIVRRAGQPSSAAQADDTSSLRDGVITAVSAEGDQIEINGSWLNLVDGKTRVFQQGRTVKRDYVTKGQKVKFNLAPSDPKRATVGVLYVP